MPLPQSATYSGRTQTGPIMAFRLPLTIAALFMLAAAPVILAAAPALAGPKMAAERVYKIDGVTATAKGSSIAIQAKGAVNSGGWTQARLRLVHNDGRTLTLELLAVPPPPDMTVIDVLVPVKAGTEVRVKPGIATVKVQAEANEITTQILH